MATLPRQHWQNSALTHLLCSKVLGQEQPDSAQEHREQSSAVPQGRIPAQGLLQPTFKLKSLRAEVTCVFCVKSKGFIVIFYNKA